MFLLFNGEKIYKKREEKYNKSVAKWTIKPYCNSSFTFIWVFAELLATIYRKLTHILQEWVNRESSTAQLIENQARKLFNMQILILNFLYVVVVVVVVFYYNCWKVINPGKGTKRTFTFYLCFKLSVVNMNATILQQPSPVMPVIIMASHDNEFLQQQHNVGKFIYKKQQTTKNEKKHKLLLLTVTTSSNWNSCCHFSKAIMAATINSGKHK